MKMIELTQGKVALVDDEDYDELSRYTWGTNKVKTTFYARRGKWDNKRSSITMHQQITGYTETDHIDGNGLNNQRYNLRDCTHSQNSMNQRIRIKKSSKFKGVSVKGKRWRAYITVKCIRYHIGIYDSEKIAALRYNQKAKELFGEFAKLNVVEET